MEISDILFRRIKVGEYQKLFLKNLICRNSVDSVVEILSEILRVFTQITEVQVQKCLAEPKQNVSRTPCAMLSRTLAEPLMLC